MAEYCVKFGAMHETALRKEKSREDAIKAATEKWQKAENVEHDKGVIVEFQPDGKEKTIVDTPELSKLVRQHSEGKGAH